MKKRTTQAAMAIFVMLFLAMTVIAGGCGGSTKGSGNEGMPAASSQAAAPSQAAASTAGASASSSSTSGSASGSDVESDAGVTYSFDNQQLGSGFPPELLKVVDVRWSDHGSYFRIVFDIKKLDGSDSSYVPQFGVSYEMDHYTFSLYIVGTSVADPAFSTLGAYVSLGDSVLDSMAQVMPAGSGEGTFNVHLSAPHGCRLSYATGPLRLIVDIDK